jgi:translation initiation factor IF-3
MEVVGIIKLLDETQEIGTNSFKKRQVVVTTADQYPQDILIEFTQDKVNLLNEFTVGSSVKIAINLRGREWINPQGEAKYFNSLQGWKIEQA